MPKSRRKVQPPLQLVVKPNPQPYETELWDIDRPKDYPQNARKWPAAAIQKVATSIREFGFVQPVVVDAEEVIIIGHLRRHAARTIGYTQVPVHIAKNLDPVQVRQLRLLDNRSHEEAKWDYEVLAAELRSLEQQHVDLGLTGFDTREFDGLLGPTPGLTDPNAVPPVPISAPGDIWLLDEHRVLCGDATDADQVNALLAGQEPVLLLTDPPYGIELDSEWRDRAGLNTAPGEPRTPLTRAFARTHPEHPAEPSYMKHRVEGHTETTISGDTRADWSEAFALVPSLQVAYVWHASVHTAEVLDGLRRIGFLYPEQIIWNKGRTILTRTHYWYQHEVCWYVRKKNAPWFGMPGQNSTIWDAPSPKFIMQRSQETKFDHPTQKPVALMDPPVINHTAPGEIVYDPFLGSGTTLIACQMRDRLCYGVELEPRYVDVIIERWQNFTGKTALLEGTNETFEEVKSNRLAAKEIPHA